MTIAFSPRDLTPLYASAVALLNAGNLAAAREQLLRSLHEEGETALSYHYLAQILERAGGPGTEVLAAQANALKCAPNHPVFLAALGVRLVDAGRDQDALVLLRKALEIDPQNPLALPWVMRLNRRYLQWTSYEEEAAACEMLLKSAHKVDPLLSLTFVDDPAQQLKIAARSAPDVAVQPLEPHAPHEKIRVGYFSADFSEHATMHLIEGLIEAHDKGVFEFHVYDFKPDPTSRQHQIIREFADCYHDVSALSAAQTAALARQEQLDIAVDLKGITTDSRPMIFALRVAPVQVSFLGFPGTTAIAEMDYMIADRITIPDGDERFYSEKILRLPGCYQPNTNSRILPEGAGGRAAFGLPDDRFVFASFNHPHKVGPSEFATWMEILREVPQAVLLFYSGKADLGAALAERAQAHGVEPSRVLACGPLPQTAHLERIAQVDLCLDCFAYNAHTTASDAVWAGVPLLTLAGRQFAARVATSILSTAGVPELSTVSTKDYVAKAVHLATHPEDLLALRQKISAARHGSPLFDTKRWTRDYEALLQMCYQRHRAGEAPDHMSLSDG